MDILKISERTDPGIVWMKFFAAIFITMSHVDIMVPEQYKLIVTGGALGNAMFFFCSGLTLFKGRNDGFFNWYGRRIRRIYPSIIVWYICLSAFLGFKEPIYTIVTAGYPGGYWFVWAIMIYYFIFYWVRKYLSGHLKRFFYCCLFAISILSLFMIDYENRMYATMDFMHIAYFLFMLLGAVVSNIKIPQVTFQKGIFWAISGFFGYYICMGLYSKIPFTCNFQLVSLFILLLSMVGYYIFFNCQFMSNIIKKQGIIGKLIYFMSALTLEIYIVQESFITDKLNCIFPFNIVVIYIIIVFMAYILHCLSRVFSNIFNGTEWDWKYIISL